MYIIDGYRHDSASNVITKDDVSYDAVKFCGSQLYYTEEGMKSYMSTGNRLIVRYYLITSFELVIIAIRLSFDEKTNQV